MTSAALPGLSGTQPSIGCAKLLFSDDGLVEVTFLVSRSTKFNMKKKHYVMPSGNDFQKLTR